MSGFRGRDVLSIRDLSRADIDLVLRSAKKMVPIAVGEKRSRSLEGKILSTLFYEPSTRTRLSFESAMARLGGRALGFSGSEGTSVQKGETLADTVRMVEAYSDAIVLRHPHEGAARLGNGRVCTETLAAALERTVQVILAKVPVLGAKN